MPSQQNQVIGVEAWELFSLRLQHSFSMCDVELFSCRCPENDDWACGETTVKNMQIASQILTFTFLLKCKNWLHAIRQRAVNYFAEVCLLTNQRYVKLF